MGGDRLVGHVCGDDIEDRYGDELRDLWADRYRELLPEVHPIPAPDLPGVALGRAGGHTAVLVGDSVWDGYSATRLSATFVGVRSGGVSDGELTEAGAVRVVDGVGEPADRRWRP